MGCLSLMLSCMPCCFHSRTAEERAETKHSIKLEKLLHQDSRKQRAEYKILMLGTGESGKSTVVKQMKVLHHNGYTREELLNYRSDIYKNVVESIQQLLLATKKLDVCFDVPESLAAVQSVLALNADDYQLRLPPDVVSDIDLIWNHSGLKSLYVKCIEISHVIDSAPYFLDQLHRIADPEYVPIEMDVLKARIKTIGISESRFKVGKRVFNLIDLGGQFSERKKWINAFGNVSAIIFCVSLSDYDQVTSDDPEQKGQQYSRMLDSLVLFESIVNSVWFSDTLIVLFLNKIDIFRKKIPLSPLQKCDPEYHGNTVDAAMEHIKKRFLSLNYRKLKIYPYYTCATDTEQMRTILAAIEESILTDSLNATGML